MIRVENISFSYHKSAPVLKDASFRVSEGALCVLFGPNGSGKTTLFKCCLNLLKPAAGKVIINGKDVLNMSYAETAKIISYIPQEYKTPFNFSVWEMVLMGRTPHISDIFGACKKDREISAKAMSDVGIDALANRKFNELSGGQRQMVLIARALAQNAKTMFLDEPSSALDFSNQIKIWKLIKNISETGVTVVACVHNPNDCLWHSDEIVFLKNGAVIDNGKTAELLTQSALDKIYPGKGTIKSVDGTKAVFPKK